MMNLSKLRDLSAAKKFSEGTLIIREGDTSPYCMYIVLMGVVGVYKHYGQPDERMITLLKPGDFFGEMSLFLLRPRSATVIAMEDVVALEINQPNAYEIIEKHPDISFNMIRTLCMRVNELNLELQLETGERKPEPRSHICII